MGFIVQRAEFACSRGRLCFYFVWKKFHAVEIQDALLQTQRNTGNMCIRLYYTAVSTAVRPLFVEPLHWDVFLVCVLCIPLGEVNIRLCHSKSRGCSGNVIKRLWIGISEIGSSIPDMDRQSYLLCRVQIGSGTPPNGYWSSNAVVKPPGWSWPLTYI